MKKLFIKLENTEPRVLKRVVSVESAAEKISKVGRRELSRGRYLTQGHGEFANHCRSA